MSSAEPKPRCHECGRPYDLQEEKPVMNGAQRAGAWIAFFLAAAAAVGVVFGARCDHHRADVEKQKYELCVAASSGRVEACKSLEEDSHKKVECTLGRSQYSCCISDDVAKQHGCWR